MMIERTRRRLTEEEHLRLIDSSDHEHPVVTSFGVSGVYLLPKPVNEWAFALLDDQEGAV